MSDPKFSDTVTAINYLGFRRINQNDRLFEPINNLLIIFSSLAHASSMMVGGRTHQTGHPAARINTSQYPHAFVFPLRGPLEHALLEKIPEFIEIGMTPNADKILENAKLQTAGLHKCVHYFAAPVFIGFFERYNEWLTDNYGDGINWHPTLNFCRIIRNAAAHGSIHFRNPGAPAVTWRGITLGPANNGEQVIGPDLRLGDMIGLMFEADDELTAIGAPIL